MEVSFGGRKIAFPGAELGVLNETGAGEAEEAAVVRERLADDGYVLLRDFLPRDSVAAARASILEFMAEKEALTEGTPVLEGVMPDGGKTVSLLGRRDVTHREEVLGVFESPRLFGLFERLLGEEPLTYGYKWLRAVGNEKFTGAHFDVVYMGRGSGRVHTVWIPLGDIEPEQGTLAMLEGSHRLPSFEKIRATYGAMDVDRDAVEGWFSTDPLSIAERYGGAWKTAAYRMGDVIFFGLYTMHASTTNTTNRYRLSADVRFQPSSEPADPRWAGSRAQGHGRFKSGSLKTMEAARREWGV